MKRIIIIASLILGMFTPKYSQVIVNKPLSQRQTGYNIDANLDTRAATITGSMRAFWVNLSADVVDEVQMHMYLNAFRNTNSTFMKESGSSFSLPASDSGFVEVLKISDGSGLDLLPLMEYISPDDGNPDDKTVVKIRLPRASMPGDTVWLEMDFISRLPGRLFRTGHSNNYFFAGQWFPKFGVYEKAGMRYSTRGAWNCHQFHRHSEFYSDHSVYNVAITLPSEYIMGSGGVTLSETENGDSTKTVKFRAEDIVDFAWVAWPGFSVHKDQWNDVEITFLYPPERKNQVERQIRAVKNALEYLHENIGPFPWPHLTFIDPPSFGSGSGGMEYTTMFTSASVTGIPAFLRFPELVTIHEFGHAYFMGILASNEFEEPWIDEGMNTYWETRIMDHYYGERNNLLDHPLLKFSDKSYVRMSYVHSPERQLVTNAEYSWNYPSGTYGMMSYQKAGLIFNTLEGIIGRDLTDEIFREYYRKWAFRHPSGKDFIDVTNDVYARNLHTDSLKDLNWFFSQTLYGTDICDYEVADITNRLVPGTDSTYRSVIRLRRTGGLKFPVKVLVKFTSGEEVSELWNGTERFRDLEYTGNRRVKSATIDPEFLIRMDVNYTNNSLTTEPDRLPVRRLYVRLITFIQLLTSLLFI